MAHSKTIDNKCRECAERKRDENGKLYCPHIKCIFGEDELKFWRDIGGAILIPPSDLGLND